MISIRIKNLRSLKDTDFIGLKAINILVGMNSSGKSTLLRTFPLLRQSIERRTRGPLLWNGDYTDFESFRTSVRKELNANEREGNTAFDSTIEIGMKFNIPIQPQWTYQPNNETAEITCSIGIKEGITSGSSYIYKYIVEINRHEIIFDFNEKGIIEKIESKKIRWELGKVGLKYERSAVDTLLPVFTDVKNRARGFYTSGSTEITKKLLSFVVDKIRELSGSKAQRINYLARNISRRLDTYKNRLTAFKSFKSTYRWEKTVESWDISSSDFDYLSAILDLIFIIDNSALINDELTKILKNIHYIAPLRASTDRYYRHQDLGLDEIDHKGANLAMFLNNMNSEDKELLDNWTKENFGFKIINDTNSSHLSLRITNDGVNSYNIADIGFGYSQILPIIVSLWSISSGYEYRIKDKLCNIYIVTIEQPELHLHPKMQANLADVFAKSITLARNNGIDIRYIIETHSQHLVSRFGDLIADGNKHDLDDINVILFDKELCNDQTHLRYSHFNQDGVLENWPIGFFNY